MNQCRVQSLTRESGRKEIEYSTSAGCEIIDRRLLSHSSWSYIVRQLPPMWHMLRGQKKSTACLGCEANSGTAASKGPSQAFPVHSWVKRAWPKCCCNDTLEFHAPQQKKLVLVSFVLVSIQAWKWRAHQAFNPCTKLPLRNNFPTCCRIAQAGRTILQPLQLACPLRSCSTPNSPGSWRRLQ